MNKSYLENVINEINLLADIDLSSEIKLLSEFNQSGKDNDLNTSADINSSEINQSASVNANVTNHNADNDLYFQHAYNIKDRNVAEALIIYLSGMRVGNIDKFCKARKITKPTLYANISKIEEANNIDLLKIAKDNATLIKDFTRIINSLNALKYSHIDILKIIGDVLIDIIINEVEKLKKDK